jgi:hypothetical protein
MDAFRVLEPVDVCSPLFHGSLPSLGNIFSIPNLEEKPQNPIIQHLEKLEGNAQQTRPFILRHRASQALPKELAILSERILVERELEYLNDDEANSIWELAAKETTDYQVCFICLS